MVTIASVVIRQSRNLLASATSHDSQLQLSLWEQTQYSSDDLLCAAFIRDARSNPSANHHLDKDICLICTL